MSVVLLDHMPQNGGMQITRIDHVQLAMPPGREQDAVTFYEGLLGIPEVPKPAHLAVRGGCWFERGELKSTSVSKPISVPRKRRTLRSRYTGSPSS